MIAEGEGLLTLDEPVAKTITEWKGDEQKEKITIRHLLTFTSGLKNIDRSLHGRSTKDKYAASIAGAVASEAGRKFRYGSNHLMVFGEVMKRKLAKHEDKAVAGNDVLAYLENRVFDPIGMKHGLWIRDQKKNPLLPYGAYVTWI